MAQKHLIFFHGGGSEEDYQADAKLVASLKSNLGAQDIPFTILYSLTMELRTSVDESRSVRKSLGAKTMLF